MEKHNVRCRDDEDVFQAARREWGDDVMVIVDGVGRPVYAHSSPDTIEGRVCLGTVTVRRGESFYVVGERA